MIILKVLLIALFGCCCTKLGYDIRDIKAEIEKERELRELNELLYELDK